MDTLLLPIIHPRFERMKQSSLMLHLTAALLIVLHALSHKEPKGPSVVLDLCQYILALDISILALAGRGILTQMPFVNIIFRTIELIFFLGIAVSMCLTGKWLGGCFHLCLTAAYGILLYYERNLYQQRELMFNDAGVLIPDIPENRFLSWSEICYIETHYHAIHIEPVFCNQYDFEFRKNLSFGQLEQIHEFCGYYLKSDG